MVKAQNKPGSRAVRVEKKATATVFPAKQRMLVKTRAFKSIVGFSASLFRCTPSSSSYSVGRGGGGGGDGGGAFWDEPEPLPEPDLKKDDAAILFPPKKKKKRMLVKTRAFKSIVRFTASLFCCSSSVGRGGGRGGAVWDEPDPLPEPNLKKDDAAVLFPPKKKKKKKGMLVKTMAFKSMVHFFVSICSSSSSGEGN